MYIFHQIDGAVDGLGVFPVSGVDGAVQGRLDRLSQPGAGGRAVIKHLGPMDRRVVGHTVLVDADEHRLRLAVDQGHPVLQVRHLLLPQGDSLRRINRVLPCPGQHGVPAQKQQHVPQPPGDGQVQVAFHHPVRGHRAAVLAAMSSVQNDGPAARSGGVYSGRPSRQQQHRRSRRKIPAAKYNDHLRTPFGSPYAGDAFSIPYHIFR